MIMNNNDSSSSSINNDENNNKYYMGMKKSSKKRQRQPQQKQRLRRLSLAHPNPTISLPIHTLPSPPHQHRYLENNSSQLSYGLHYMNVWVGTPPKRRMTLILSIRSDVTLLACDREEWSSQSTSFERVVCGDDVCESAEGSFCGGEELCMVNGTRLAEEEGEGGDGASYFLANDVASIVGQANGEMRYNNSYGFPLKFGCMTSVDSLSDVFSVSDGIASFSGGRWSFVSQMNLPSSDFSLCFDEASSSSSSTAAGVITFGGMNPTLETTPVIYSKNTHISTLPGSLSSPFYGVKVKRLYLRRNGGTSAKISGDDQATPVEFDVALVNGDKGGAVIDNGLRETRFNVAAQQEFMRVWQEMTGKAFPPEPNLSKEDLSQLPTILIQLEGHDDNRAYESLDNVIGLVGDRLDPTSPNDVLLAVPSNEYLYYNSTTHTYRSLFHFDHPHGTTLAANVMQGKVVLFDNSRQRIGFAEHHGCYDAFHSQSATDAENDQNTTLDDTNINININISPSPTQITTLPPTQIILDDTHTHTNNASNYTSSNTTNTATPTLQPDNALEVSRSQTITQNKSISYGIYYAFGIGFNAFIMLMLLILMKYRAKHSSTTRLSRRSSTAPTTKTEDDDDDEEIEVKRGDKSDANDDDSASSGEHTIS